MMIPGGGGQGQGEEGGVGRSGTHDAQELSPHLANGISISYHPRGLRRMPSTACLLVPFPPPRLPLTCLPTTAGPFPHSPNPSLVIANRGRGLLHSFCCPPHPRHQASHLGHTSCWSLALRLVRKDYPLSHSHLSVVEASSPPHHTSLLRSLVSPIRPGCPILFLAYPLLPLAPAASSPRESSLKA